MLRLKNFHTQTTVEEQLLVHFINQIPSASLNGLHNIIYDPYRQYQRSYINSQPVDQRVKGQYDTIHRNNIFVYEISSFDELKHIICHEVGHHVYSSQLQLAQKQQWAKIVRESSRTISDYARHSIEEDFCETFAFFILNRARVMRYPKRHAFLKSLTFNGAT